MFANFLIGLREGLEAALVVGILVAYMVRTGNRHRLAPIWTGVLIAVVARFGVGALGREGLETAVFVWSAVSAAGSGASPVAGAVLGLLTATVVGWLLYKGSVRINLASFFTFTGAALVVVAAGVLAYGLHDLQEA